MSTGKRKRFSRDTNTWRMFEKLFLDTTCQHPTRLGPFGKGKIINLVQGLNCCNIQWAEEMRMPLNMLTLSAKAIKGIDDASWFLEVSTNYRQQGLASPSGKGSNWLSGLLANMPDSPTQGIAPGGELASSGSRSGSAAPGEQEDWVDPQEKLLAGFLGEKS